MSWFKDLYRFFHPRYQALFLEYPVDMRPRYGHGLPPHAELYTLLDAHRSDYTHWLSRILTHATSLQAIARSDQDHGAAAPVWNNGFLPGLDMAALYTMLAHYRPARYVEVGSGNSTKVAAYVRRREQLPTRIISIDPQPRAEIDALADEVVRQPFETTDLALFTLLEAGDIVFIDNSHRVLPNSDATVFFLEVLPRLRPGVIVHIHDIYLPYDYPPFMCERFYSEQYLLAAYLLANPARYKPLFPAYFVSEQPELAARLSPLWAAPNLQGVERHGGSFWLEIGAG